MGQKLKHNKEIIKLLAEDIKRKLHNIGFGNDLLDLMPTAQAAKEKNK